MEQKIYLVISEQLPRMVRYCPSLDLAWHVAEQHDVDTGEVCAVWEETDKYVAFRGSTRVGRCG